MRKILGFIVPLIVILLTLNACSSNESGSPSQSSSESESSTSGCDGTGYGLVDQEKDNSFTFISNCAEKQNITDHVKGWFPENLDVSQAFTTTIGLTDSTPGSGAVCVSGEPSTLCFLPRMLADGNFESDSLILKLWGSKIGDKRYSTVWLNNQPYLLENNGTLWGIKFLDERLRRKKYLTDQESLVLTVDGFLQINSADKGIQLCNGICNGLWNSEVRMFINDFDDNSTVYVGCKIDINVQALQPVMLTYYTALGWQSKELTLADLGSELGINFRENEANFMKVLKDRTSQSSGIIGDALLVHDGDKEVTKMPVIYMTNESWKVVWEEVVPRELLK